MLQHGRVVHNTNPGAALVRTGGSVEVSPCSRSFAKAESSNATSYCLGVRSWHAPDSFVNATKLYDIILTGKAKMGQRYAPPGPHGGEQQESLVTEGQLTLPFSYKVAARVWGGGSGTDRTVGL